MTSTINNSQRSQNQSVQRREYTIKVPKTSNEQRTFSIMKFSGSLNIDPTRWPRERLKMAREDNRRQPTERFGDSLPEFGQGSEYGRAAREEARRKRYGRNIKQYEHDQQPWLLAIQPSDAVNSDGEQEQKFQTKGRRFRSIRESGATEYADYWVFLKTGEDFEAFKIDDWHQFLPAVDRLRVLDEEQAEERFAQRDKVFNQLALKAQIKRQLEGDDDPELRSATQSAQKLIIRDRDERGDDSAASDGDDEGDGEDGGEINNKKKKESTKKVQKRRNKKPTKEEEFTRPESDDGDGEGKELDYISDDEDSSDDEGPSVDVIGKRREKEDVEEEQQEKDESDPHEDDSDNEDKGIKSKGSEVEENDEDEEEERIEAQSAARKSRKMLTKRISIGNSSAATTLKGVPIPMELDNEQGQSDESSSDEDPDRAGERSVLFLLPVSGESEGQQGSTGAGRKRAAEFISEKGDQKQGGKKQKLEKGFLTSSQQTSSQSSSQQSSNSKASTSTFSLPINLVEEHVRCLLERRPHSTRELMTKIKENSNRGLVGETPPAKWSKEEQQIMVNILSDVLKRLHPYQFKKMVKEKETLFFSLTKNKE